MSPTPSLKRNVASHERRLSMRVPLTTPVQYTVGRLKGRGVTCNVSNSGLLIKTDRVLPTGRQIQLVINWPAKLNKEHVLLLVADGRVVRSTAEGTAVELRQGYEFRFPSS
jgi:hypothetical protein